MSTVGAVTQVSSQEHPQGLDITDVARGASSDSPSDVPSVAPSRSSSSSPSPPSRWARWKLGLIHLASPSWVVIGLLLAVVIVEALALSWVQIANYSAFKTYQGDLGDYNQAFSTTIHGQGFFYFTTNIPALSGGHLFTVHFSPFMLLLVPFYALSPTPATLIILKQIALGLGALPLYGLARVYFPKGVLPIIFAAAYLASPITLSIDWNNFDPEAFIPLLVLIALYFHARGQVWPFVASWIIALSIIESVAPFLMLFAGAGLIATFFFPPLSPWLNRRTERSMLFIAFVSATLWLVLAYAVLYASSPIGGAFGIAYGGRYTVLGATSLPDVIPRALTNPAAAAAALQYQGSLKLLFVAVLIVGSGAVSLLGGLRYLLPVAGYLTLSLLSNDTLHYTFGSQYPAYVAAFLFVGAVEGAVLVVSMVSGPKAVTRRNDIVAGLRDEAHALLVRLETLDISSPTRTQVMAHIQRATDLLQQENPASAYRQLRLARSVVADYACAAQAEPDRADARASPLSRIVRGLRAQLKHPSPGEVTLSFVVILFVVVASIYASPLASTPAAGDSTIAYGYPAYNAHDSILQNVIDLIPPGGSVLTTGHLFPEVSGRPNAYVLPNGIFIAGNRSFGQAMNTWVNASQFVLTDYLVDAQAAVILQYFANLSPFGLYAAADGAYLYERNWASSPDYWIPWTTSWAGGALTPVTASTSQQFASALGPSLYHPRGGTSGVNIWTGPDELYLPPGNYAATFDFEMIAPTPGKQLELRATATPAKVSDTLFAVNSLGSHHEISISHSTAKAVVLNQSTFNTTKILRSATLETVTLHFSWDSTGYVGFPGIELATDMSLYLVSIDVTQSGVPP